MKRALCLGPFLRKSMYSRQMLVYNLCWFCLIGLGHAGFNALGLDDFDQDLDKGAPRAPFFAFI